MTLNPQKDKKSTTVDIHADSHERKTIADTIAKVRKQLIFDINKTRLPGNIKAIQGAPDSAGATDPITYLKLDNFLKQLEDGIRTEATQISLDMGPNEISKESGDPATNRIYTKTLNSILMKFDEHLWKGEGGIFYPSKFEVKGIFDLSQVEGLTSGEDLSQARKKGKTIPEYGATKVPPADRLYGLRGSKKVLANRAFVVIMQDTEEAGMSHDLQTPIKIENYNNLMRHKRVKIEGVGPTTLNGYREDGKIRPKTKLQLLQMAAAFTVGMNEGIIGPRPIVKPQVRSLPDPDNPRQDPRKYYFFTIGGFTGSRGAAIRAGTEAAMTGVQAMPEVED